MGSQLLNAFALEDPGRLAELLETSDDAAEALSILMEIPPGLRSDVAARLSPVAAERVLGHQPDSALIEWLSSGPADAARRLLAKFSQDRANRLISGIADRSKRRAFRRFLNYPAGSVGQLTQVHMLTAAENEPASEIDTRIQRLGTPLEGPIPILNQAGRVIGILDLTRFVQNRSSAGSAVSFCIPVEPVFADSPATSLKQPAAWGKLGSLPVVDHEQRLIGYVTRHTLDDALGLKKQSNLFLDSAVELANQFWSVLVQLTILLLGRGAER